ncbi:hypothetical protein TCAL_16357 [Tigriopus californicus]|uniref:Uncharacterized protein n=1 Tax=Tigriopus californicus TaxID=6832 RepID=A0A553NZ21_TIGCA|nr:hypothetical protein TCAL_16357 [Tigriopus californicus]
MMANHCPMTTFTERRKESIQFCLASADNRIRWAPRITREAQPCSDLACRGVEGGTGLDPSVGGPHLLIKAGPARMDYPVDGFLLSPFTLARFSEVWVDGKVFPPIRQAKGLNHPVSESQPNAFVREWYRGFNPSDPSRMSALITGQARGASRIEWCALEIAQPQPGRASLAEQQLQALQVTEGEDSAWPHGWLDG